LGCGHVSADDVAAQRGRVDRAVRAVGAQPAGRGDDAGAGAAEPGAGGPPGSGSPPPAPARSQRRRPRAHRGHTAGTPRARIKADADLAGHVRADCALRDHPTLGRWLRQTPTGRLVIDKAAVVAEERLDGKYLLSTSDPHMSPGDVALGYKNLLEAERGFRDLKSTLELRPVFHRI
jgi:hypothetical protein